MKKIKNTQKRELVNLIYTNGIKLLTSDKLSHQQQILRARELEDKPVVQAYLHLLSTGVIASGFELSNNAKNQDGQPDRYANKLIKDSWMDWTSRCGINGESLTSILKKLIYREAIDGEVFVHIVQDETLPYGIGIRVLPALMVPYSKIDGKDSVINGIEYDYLDRPITYYVGKELGNKYYPIKANQIIHFFDRAKSDKRGKSIIYPLDKHLKQIEQLRDTFALAALTAAELNVYIESDTDIPDEYIRQGVDDPDAIVLAPGQKVSGFNSNIPNGNTEEMINGIIMECAAILGVSYNTLKRSVSQSSFSGLKYSHQSDIQKIIDKQRHVIEGVLNPLFARWLHYMLSSNQLSPLPASKFVKFNKPVFTGEYPAPLSPEKEASFIQTMLDNGLASKNDITTRMFGRPYQQILADRAKEKQEEDAYPELTDKDKDDNKTD